MTAPKPTLAEVLRASDAIDGAGPERDVLRELAALKALAWVNLNRPALERFELERAAREVCGVDEWTPVRLFASNDEPERMLVYYGGTDCQVVEIVEVGRGWTPEVGK